MTREDLEARDATPGEVRHMTPSPSVPTPAPDAGREGTTKAPTHAVCSDCGGLAPRRDPALDWYDCPRCDASFVAIDPTRRAPDPLAVLRNAVAQLSPDAETMRREERFALFREASVALAHLEAASPVSSPSSPTTQREEPQEPNPTFVADLRSFIRTHAAEGPRRDHLLRVFDSLTECAARLASDAGGLGEEERWSKVAELAREHNRLDPISGFTARDKRRTLKAKIVEAACDAARASSPVEVPHG